MLSMTSKKANLEDVFIELTEGESGVERSGDREEQDIPAVADDAGDTARFFRKTEDCSRERLKIPGTCKRPETLKIPGTCKRPETLKILRK